MARNTRNIEAMREVAARITPVDEVNPHVKVLVYGANGSGKTRFAATAPACLIIDITEQGTRSATGSGARKIEVDTWDDVGHLYWLLASGKTKFQSVALDTITGLQGLAMSKVLDDAESRDPARESRMPDKRTYGRAGELMRGMLYAFRNLPMHVIFTAQERQVKDDDTGEVLHLAVDLPNSSRGAATAAVSILGYMKPKEVPVRNKAGKIRRQWVDEMMLAPSEDYASLKDRTNQLGPVFRNPNIPRMIEAWANIEETASAE